MSQTESAWAIAEELMSQNMLDVPIHVAAPVIAKVLASRAPATTPTDQILTPSGAFTQAVREKVLMPSPCGVAGHFEFQLNGGSCMMCQREQRLVSEALKERVVECKECKEWKDTLEMYQTAWMREIGGFIVRKSHQIDGFVLRTRAALKEQYEKGKQDARDAWTGRDKWIEEVGKALGSPQAAAPGGKESLEYSLREHLKFLREREDQTGMDFYADELEELLGHPLQDKPPISSRTLIEALNNPAYSEESTKLAKEVGDAVREEMGFTYACGTRSIGKGIPKACPIHGIECAPIAQDKPPAARRGS